MLILWQCLRIFTMCLAQRKYTKLLFVHPLDLKDRLKSFSIPKCSTFPWAHHPVQQDWRKKNPFHNFSHLLDLYSLILYLYQFLYFYFQLLILPHRHCSMVGDEGDKRKGKIAFVIRGSIKRPHHRAEPTVISTQAESMLNCWKARDINKQVRKSRGGRKHHSQLGSWDLEQLVTFLLSHGKCVASLRNRSYLQNPSSMAHTPRKKTHPATTEYS